MKVYFLVILLLFVQGNNPSNTTGDKVKEFYSEKGKFVVLMPDKPTEDIVPKETKIGTINFIRYKLETNEITYVIAFSPIELSEETKANLTDDKIEQYRKVYFVSAKRGLLNSLGEKGKILEEKDIAINQFPAKEVVIEVAPNIICKARITLANLNSYLIMAIIKKQTDSSFYRAGKFLNSFNFQQSE